MQYINQKAVEFSRTEATHIFVGAQSRKVLTDVLSSKLAGSPRFQLE
jgi:hypothetical protein